MIKRIPHAKSDESNECSLKISVDDDSPLYIAGEGDLEPLILLLELFVLESGL